MSVPTDAHALLERLAGTRLNTEIRAMARELGKKVYGSATRMALSGSAPE